MSPQDLMIMSEKIYELESKLSASEAKLEIAKQALTGIDHCMGHCPLHLNEDYHLLLKITEGLRTHASEALSKIRGDL